MKTLKLTGANERDIPDIGRRVAYGEEFDVTDEQAESLLIQNIFDVVTPKIKETKGVE